jgi:hypothetical protein
MSESAQPQGVVFIASDVPDLQDLLNGLQPGEQAFIIDPSSDGLQQIADILAANDLTDLASISIVAHGASGELDLGASPLIDPDLAGDSNALAEIGAALAPGGAIQLYGCEVAEGAAGQQFINDFSTLAGGVTVEASTNIVGSAALGGSWTLDAVSNGTAAPFGGSPPFTPSVLDQFQGDLFLQPIGPPGLPPAAFPTLTDQWEQGSNPNALVLDDQATLAGGDNPTGTITFTLYGPGSSTTPVDTEQVAVNGNGTYTTPTGYTVPDTNAALGPYQWDVAYSGDVFNVGTSDNNDPNAAVSVVDTTTLSTTPNSTVVDLGVNPVTLTDTADLENGDNPTGTIIFTLIAPDGTTLDTETVTVSGNGTYTTPTGSTLVPGVAAFGTYQWDASYSGDSFNGNVSDSGDPAERVTVSAANPTISATPDSTTVTLGSNPVLLTDTAVLSGGYNPAGSIHFTLFAPDGTRVDAEQVTVSGNGSYTAPGFTLDPGAETGTYQWNASFISDTGTIVSDFDNAAEQVTVNPCYCAGTLILTDRGEVPVETLAIGDNVVTASGAPRRIKWVGRRSYAGRFVMGRKDILPICIKAGALGDNVPKRDLWISPHHAMYFADEARDGVLIEAKDLVNGVSIVQAERVKKVEYFHIEIDSHDVIIAEGALSETFIDDDSRGMFHNAHEYKSLYADDVVAAVAHYCAPRLEEGYVVEEVRRRVAARAGLLRIADGEHIGALRGLVDQVSAACITGWAQNVDHPEAAVCLDIYAGGRLIGQTLANGYREDLEQAKLGSGYHSFTFTPPAGFDFAADTVEVRRALDGAALEFEAGFRRAPQRVAAKRLPNVSVHRRAARG